MRRLAAVVVIAATLAAGLTGCGGRFAQDHRPSPAASTPAADDSVDGVLSELDAVDDTLTDAEQDAVAGDEAARTDDAP